MDALSFVLPEAITQRMSPLVALVAHARGSRQGKTLIFAPLHESGPGPKPTSQIG